MARYQFGALRPVGSDATAARIDEARRTLPPSQDASIARLFIEMAAAALDGSETTKPASAAIILNDILPAYAAALAAPVVPTAASRDVGAGATITLVRWPFT